MTIQINLNFMMHDNREGDIQNDITVMADKLL